jgi:ubiquitin
MNVDYFYNNYSMFLTKKNTPTAAKPKGQTKKRALGGNSSIKLGWDD